MPCTPWVIDALQAVCDELGASCMVMPSGAGHDTQHVAVVADVGMYFIPSAHGIAHTPDEYTAIEDLTYGTEILAETLRRLADREGP